MPVDTVLDKKDSPPTDNTAPEPKGEILNLYFLKNVPQAEIGRRINKSRQYVNSVIAPYKHIILSAEQVDFVRANYNRILWSVNANLLLDLLDPVKRSQASLNNTAYAQGTIDKQIRLEDGRATDNIDITGTIRSLKSTREVIAKEMARVNSIPLVGEVGEAPGPEDPGQTDQQ